MPTKDHSQLANGLHRARYLYYLDNVNTFTTFEPVYPLYNFVYGTGRHSIEKLLIVIQD